MSRKSPENYERKLSEYNKVSYVPRTGEGLSPPIRGAVESSGLRKQLRTVPIKIVKRQRGLSKTKGGEMNPNIAPAQAVNLKRRKIEEARGRWQKGTFANSEKPCAKLEERKGKGGKKVTDGSCN